MGPTAKTRTHLKLLEGGDHPAAWPTGAAGSPVLRVPIGPGEWALALLTDNTGPSALLPTQDSLRQLRASHPGHPGYPGPAGRRWAVARAQPAAMDPRIGPAVIHHSSARTVLYCQADQITTQAADALGALAARAAEILSSSAAQGSRQVDVFRVRHRDLPVDLHPAVMTVRGGQISAHICSRLITHELAAAISTLCTAYACHLAAWRATPLLRWAAEPSSPRWMSGTPSARNSAGTAAR